MTPLGSAGGPQERVRVVAVGEAISIAGGPPGTISIKYEAVITIVAVRIPGATKTTSYSTMDQYVFDLYLLVLFLQQLKPLPQCCLTDKQH